MQESVNKQSMWSTIHKTYLVAIVMKHGINKVFKHYIFVFNHKAVSKTMGSKFYHHLIRVTQHA